MRFRTRCVGFVGLSTCRFRHLGLSPLSSGFSQGLSRGCSVFFDKLPTSFTSFSSEALLVDPGDVSQRFNTTQQPCIVRVCNIEV